MRTENVGKLCLHPLEVEVSRLHNLKVGDHPPHPIQALPFTGWERVSP